MPATWEEEVDRNVRGRASALTTLSAVDPVWNWALRLGFFFARSGFVVRMYAGTKFPALRFISFARWTLLRDLPGSPRQPLRSPYLFFESNFSGSFDQYIDAFAYVITWRIENIWRRSPGYPGVPPAGPFKNYIKRQQFQADYYYCAYSDATPAAVQCALELEQRLCRFVQEHEEAEPARFAEKYERFLTDVQLLL